MPRSAKPAAVPDYQKPQDKNDALTHFIGISMGRAGFPIRLFTTNRWVTGEVWYTAKTVIPMLDRFFMDTAYPSWPVSIWITAMVRLFRPDIETLLLQRDKAVEDWQLKHPDDSVFEDRDLDITSILEISVEDRIKQVNRALSGAKS